MGNSLLDRFTRGIGQFTLAVGEAVEAHVILPFTDATRNSFLPPKPTSPVAAVLASHGVTSVNAFVEQNYDGIPYVWGGESKNGADCSGFVIKAFRDLLHVELPHDSKEQAGFIADHFHLPLVRGGNIPANSISEKDIPPYSVISIKRPGTGHVLMAMVDEHNQVVEWDSHGGKRNGPDNPGKGVKEGSLRTLLKRLKSEGDVPVDIVNTAPLFDTGKFNISGQMLAGGWQVTLEEKSKELTDAIKNADLGNQAIDVRITTVLHSNELIDHSVFVFENGKTVLNVAAGMSENWTKFSVIKNMAEFEAEQKAGHTLSKAEKIQAVTNAMVHEATNDPAFGNWLENSKETHAYGYGINFANRVEQERALRQVELLGVHVDFAAEKPGSKTGGRSNHDNLFPALIQPSPGDSATAPQAQQSQPTPLGTAAP